jgi:hypothetical protein
MHKVTFLFLFFLTQIYAIEKPNIFFFFADDWGRFASTYQDIKNLKSNRWLMGNPFKFSSEQEPTYCQRPRCQFDQSMVIQQP